MKGWLPLSPVPQCIHPPMSQAMQACNLTSLTGNRPGARVRKAVLLANTQSRLVTPQEMLLVLVLDIQQACDPARIKETVQGARRPKSKREHPKRNDIRGSASIRYEIS